ncbi:MAG: DUF87 domain-containing protein [Candidatus Dormibacteraeota bacterium]|nr:DUF87 domain-containing protein [Candidatus Dormibacteraeota bacterium]
MSPLHLRRGPERPLHGTPPDVVVLRTGSLGYLDAAEDDRRRWISAFRALLDGLDARLQVVVDFQAGEGRPSGPQRDAETDQVPPNPDDRRVRDLGFAHLLRSAPTAQRRQVSFVTPRRAAGAVARALRILGVPNVHEAPPDHESPIRGGEEGCGWWWDDAGLHRTWYVHRYPGGDLEPGWLLRLVPPGLRLSLSWHAERLPPAWIVSFLQRQLVHLRAAQLDKPGATDPAISGALPAIEDLQRRVNAREDSAFHVGLYLTVTTHGPRELETVTGQVEAAGRAALCELLPCTFRQREGRVATTPLGVDLLQRTRVLDTSSLSTFFPWFDADLQSESGLVVGASRATGQPVLLDPFDETRYPNANIGVFGHSGAGKTYLLSTLALSALDAGSQVFVIDPEHEYGRLATRLGGLDVRLELGAPHALNVLDVNRPAFGEEALGPVVADAVDLCAVVCGGLDAAERADLEEAVRHTFAEQDEPLLGDVARRLDPTSRPGRVLQRWVTGSLGHLFSRRTNVDLDRPLVVFGMRELRPEMVAPVHFLLAQALWSRVKRRDRRRLLVIDELGLLFEDPTIRQFVVSLARRIRKYDGSLVFATQNPGDVLSSEAGAVVATNPAIHFFGAQRPGEAGRLQRHFQLSDTQRALLESARRGEFLLAAGADRLPLQVEAPPWQAALIRSGRAPPRPYNPHDGIPGRTCPSARRKSRAGLARERLGRGNLRALLAGGRELSPDGWLAPGGRSPRPPLRCLRAAGGGARGASGGRLRATPGDRDRRRAGRRRGSRARRRPAGRGNRGAVGRVQRLPVLGRRRSPPGGDEERRRAGPYRVLVDGRRRGRRRSRTRRSGRRRPHELYAVHGARRRVRHLLA